MRDNHGVSDPSASDPRIVWTGAILVTIGLSLILFACEWLATYDACVGNPAYNAGAPTGTMGPSKSLCAVPNGKRRFENRRIF
jgi:hypothetical protein